MSSRLPIEINPYRYIEQKRLIDGEIALNKLPRLKKLLSSDNNNVKVSLEFIRNEAHLPMIKGRVSATLYLMCQRCLTTVEHHVDNHLSLVLVKTNTQDVQLQASYETYLVENEMIFLPDLIEDELMLTLPMSMMHLQCEMVHPETDVFFNIDTIDTNTINNDENENHKTAKENPFTVLEKLKLKN